MNRYCFLLLMLFLPHLCLSLTASIYCPPLFMLFCFLEIVICHFFVAVVCWWLVLSTFWMLNMPQFPDNCRWAAQLMVGTKNKKNSQKILGLCCCGRFLVCRLSVCETVSGPGEGPRIVCLFHCLCHCLCICLSHCPFFGLVMSTHHSDQMLQRSQVTGIAL